MPIQPLNAVLTLTISVIKQYVEKGDLLSCLAISICRGNEALLRIMLDKKLDGTDAVWTVTHHGGRDQHPTECLADEVGGHFPTVEGAARKIPQWCLSPSWLVYSTAFARITGVGQAYQERSV